MPETMFLYFIAGALCLTFGFYLFRKTSRQYRKRKIAKRVFKIIKDIESAPQVMGYLKKVDPYAFEELLLNSFKRRGFKIIRNKRYSGDGGVDGRVIIRGYTFLVQAKRYKGHINPAHVETFNSLCEENKTYGFFIHTGKTGPMAKAHHHDRLGMISGELLVRFLTSDDTIRIMLNEKHFVEI